MGVNYLLNERLFISKNIVCEDDVATKVTRGAWVAFGVEMLVSVGSVVPSSLTSFDVIVPICAIYACMHFGQWQ